MRQTSLPRGYTRQLGNPSSSNGFTDITPPIGQKNYSAENPNARRQNKMVSSTFWANATVKTLLAANPMRSYLAIQNIGTVNIYVAFGSTPDVQGNNSIVLPPNTGITFESNVVPNNDIKIVSSTDNMVSVLEGVEI